MVPSRYHAENMLVDNSSFESPVHSPLSTCYGGRVAENGVGDRLVAIPPQTGFVECIKKNEKFTNFPL